MSAATVPVFIRNPCPPGACQCDRERLLADPASDKRVLALTREEEKRLLNACTGKRTHIRPLIIILLDTGARRGETLKLKFSDLDFACVRNVNSI